MRNKTGSSRVVCEFLLMNEYRTLSPPQRPVPTLSIAAGNNPNSRTWEIASSRGTFRILPNFIYFYFETGSHVSPAGLELSM